MDKHELKEFSANVKNKYPGVIQDLKLEYNTDYKQPHIYLALIRIKKAYRCQGIGSVVLQDVIDYANDNHIDIRLYATNIYGSDLDRLYAFYVKFGFELTNKKDGRFVYKCKKVLKSV